MLLALTKVPSKPKALAPMNIIAYSVGGIRTEVYALDHAKVSNNHGWRYMTMEPHPAVVGKIELRKTGASKLKAIKFPDLAPTLDPGLNSLVSSQSS